MQFILGKLRNQEFQGNTAHRIEPVSQGVDKGYMAAAYQLGYMYVYGKNIRKQQEKGIDLIRKSAESGYANAQGAQGYEYERGLYLEKDLVKAREWYQKSAAQK